VAGAQMKHLVELVDKDGVEEYTGPMASQANKSELGSPMPGVVEKVHVSAGTFVKEGDNILTVSAMKMEVHVKAPFHAHVETLVVAAGSKVVEGALLARLSPAASGGAGVQSSDTTMASLAADMAKDFI